jgi:hypothetical protein
MTDDMLKPLDPDVLAALASERAKAGPGAKVKARSFARLQSAIAMGSVPGNGSGTDGTNGAAPGGAPAPRCFARTHSSSEARASSAGCSRARRCTRRW